MLISKVVYSGELRTVATHLASSSQIFTDAPPDNQGKGEGFSPTDLVATATASCMLTIMGIAARTHNLAIEGTTVDVTKIMANGPRRIAEIHCKVVVPGLDLNEKEKQILENAARTCPVILSLAEEINKVISFEYL